MKTVSFSHVSALLAAFPLPAYGFAAKQQLWNPFRFVEQVSKFVNPLSPILSRGTQAIRPGDVLWQPGSNAAFQFAPLDDIVMGGVSSSNFDNRRGIWKGQVTDANNGGFVGVRSTPALKYDMSGCQGLQVRVKLQSGSEEKRFKFVTRDSTDFNGITWATSVNAKPNQETVWKIPFDKQIPTLFANKMPNQTFNKANVVGVQFVYSKFEYEGKLNPKFDLGDVELEVMEISAY